jgi:hypothetical protein
MFPLLSPKSRNIRIIIRPEFPDFFHWNEASVGHISRKDGVVFNVSVSNNTVNSIRSNDEIGGCGSSVLENNFHCFVGDFLYFLKALVDVHLNVRVSFDSVVQHLEELGTMKPGPSALRISGHMDLGDYLAYNVNFATQWNYRYPICASSSRYANADPFPKTRSLQARGLIQQDTKLWQHWVQVQSRHRFPSMRIESVEMDTLYSGACSKTSNETFSPHSRSMHKAVVSPPIPPPQTAILKSILTTVSGFDPSFDRSLAYTNCVGKYVNVVFRWSVG